MPGALFHRLLPAFLRGGPDVFPLLAELTDRLDACDRTDVAAAAADAAAPRLRDLLRPRFPSPLADALALKILNLCLARYHLRSRSAALVSRPAGLVLDPSNSCPLACPGCVHSPASKAAKRFDWPPGALQPPRYAAFLEAYGPYAAGIYFCNYGEPLLNPQTPAFIRLAKSYLLWTALSTNLSVPRLDAEACVASGLDFMVVSIDGATEPVYRRFRRRGNFELALENLRALAAAKRRLRSRTPVLSWNFLAFEHNAHEIPRAESMARAMGVDRFRVVAPFDVAWDDPEIRPAAVAPRLRRLRWRLPAPPFPRTADPDLFAPALARSWSECATGEMRHPPGQTCHWLYMNTVMDAGGRILPCCAAPRPDADLVFETFDGAGDPFNSARYRAARRSFTGAAPDDAPPPYCARCPWDHRTVNIGPPEIRRYLRAAIDRRSVRLLARW